MTSLHTASNFIGLDLFHAPPALGPGLLTQADNLLVDGGDLVTRPGFSGCFAAPLAAPLYAPTPFLGADGATWIVFVSSGRLYAWAKGTTAPAEIVIPGVSGTISGPGSRIARLGHFGYLVDGAAALVRFDLTGGATLSGLRTPAPAPVAALTSTVLDTLLTGGWAPDTLVGPGAVNRLPNANFAALTGPTPTGYTAFGNNPDVNVAPQAANLPAGNWLKLDDPYEGIAMAAALPNDAVAGDPARYAKQFLGAFDFFQGDKKGGMTVVMTVLAYSDVAGTALIGQVAQEFSLPYAAGGVAVTVDRIFSFAFFTPEVVSYRVSFGAGGGNTIAVDAPYVTNAVLFPFAAPLVAQAAASQLEVRQPQSLPYAGGTAPATRPGTAGQGRGAGGLHLSRDYGAPQDWHSFARIALALGKALGITQSGTTPPQPGPVLRLAFRQAGSTVRHYTNPLLISADGSSASVDISTVGAAVLSSFRYLEIVFGGDFVVPAASGDDLILLGPLTGAGNLGVNDLGTGDAYYWVYTEVDPNGDALLTNIVQSNPSALSATVTATTTQAEASLTLPSAPTNPAASLFYLWRFGGAFKDGLGRLITKRKFTDALAYSTDAGQPGSAGNHPNPYIALSAGPAAGTLTLTDNTPDSFLLGAETLVEGRDAPPVGASAVCAWQARLWLARGGTLYASWAVTLDQQDALYFTGANLPNDPLAQIKGATFGVGQDDADPVQALLPIATNAYFSKGFLGILKQHSIYLLSGTDPANFALQSYLIGSGRGCVAPRGCCLVEGQIWYTRADGVSSFNGDTATNQSQPVEALLRPAEGAPQQLPAAYAGAALTYHGRRVWAFVPIPGDARNTSALVWDTRQSGWTRMLTPFGVTGAASASAASDDDDLFLAGTDGQLYQVTGTQDRALPGGALTPVAFAAKSRGMGQESGDQSYWTLNTAVRAFPEVSAPVPFLGTVTVDTEMGNRWALGYTFSGLSGPRLKAPPGVKGAYHVLGLSGAAPGRVRVRSLALESAETGVPL